MTDLDAWVPLAQVARPHGVRGELRLKVFNKASDVLLDQEEVLVRLVDGDEHEVSVEGARRADEAILMKLYSVDDRDRAEGLRGAMICVRRRDFPKAAPGEFYTVDIIGGEARLAGKRMGIVTEVVSYPTLEALVVKADDGEGDWEIPLTETYVGTVDPDARVVEVRSIEELERTRSRKSKVVKVTHRPAKRGKRASRPATGGDEGGTSGEG